MVTGLAQALPVFSAEETLTLPDPSNSVGVPVLVELCLQAVVLADLYLTGSVKLGRSYLLCICCTFLSPPSFVLMEAFPLKVHSGLVPMPVKSGQREPEKFLPSPTPPTST